MRFFSINIFKSSSRTRRLIAMKPVSREPQSRTMASLVAVDVVSGPGVRRMGSFMTSPD